MFAERRGCKMMQVTAFPLVSPWCLPCLAVHLSSCLKGADREPSLDETAETPPRTTPRPGASTPRELLGEGSTPSAPSLYHAGAHQQAQHHQRDAWALPRRLHPNAGPEAWHARQGARPLRAAATGCRTAAALPGCARVRHLRCPRARRVGLASSVRCARDLRQGNVP